MWDRFEIRGEPSPNITGWREDADDAGELAASYLRSGWTSVTITDKEGE